MQPFAVSAPDNDDEPTGRELAARIAMLVGLFPTRRAAAAVGGVSVDQVGRYMAGVNAAPFPVLARLAAAQRVSLDWLATGRGRMRGGAEAAVPAQGLEVWGLSPSGEPGWSHAVPLSVRLPPVPGLSAAETVAVLVPDDSLRGEGVRSGHVCYCAVGSPPFAGDLVLARRADRLAALLPADRLPPGALPLVAPVVMVRRKW